MGRKKTEANLDIPGIRELGLTYRQRIFAYHYAITHNARASAIAAGYSPRSADSLASTILSSRRGCEQVQAAVRLYEEDILKRSGVTKNNVLKQLAYLAMADLRKILNEDGTIKRPSEWDDATAASIASLDVIDGRDGAKISKIKLWDKPAALEKLAKYLRLWAERVELEDVTIANLEERLRAAKRKAHGGDDGQ